MLIQELRPEAFTKFLCVETLLFLVTPPQKKTKKTPQSHLIMNIISMQANVKLT